MKKCNNCGFENEDLAAFCTECGASFISEDTIPEEEAADVAVESSDEVIEEVNEAAQAYEEAYEEASENNEAVSYEAEATSENPEETVEAPAFIAEPKVKKPMSPAAKKTLTGVIIVLLAAIAFYCFGSLGFMSKMGIVNSYRYENLVKNRMIQETEESPKVKLGKAFDAFFVDENNAPVSKWSVSKAENGVEVKCETVCTFESQENTVATYKVLYDYSNNIASESFAAADVVLDQAQTESVLKKLARYSDPAKTEYTTKELSSSKYNNINYYYPSGISLEMIASMAYQMSLDEFLEKYGLPADMDGTTDTAVAQNYFTLKTIADINETTVENVRATLEIDESVPETANYTEITDNFPLTKYNISEDNIEELRKEYGFGEEVTPDTLYKDVKDRIIKAQYDIDRQQKEAAEKADDEAENTETSADTEAEQVETPAAE